MIKTRNLTRVAIVVVSAVLTLTFSTLSGCSTFELERAAICCDQVKAPASRSETVHGSLWGFKWREHTVEKCEDGCGLYRVEYQTNALFLMASVLSLGLYVPQTVEWWCLMEPRDDSDKEVWDPDKDGSQESRHDPAGTKPVESGKGSL